MKCEICDRNVDEGKKHIVFECRGHNTGKIVLCKACISVGYLKKGNPIVYWDGKRAKVLEMPEVFVYPTGGNRARMAYSPVVENNGWKVVRYTREKEGHVYVPELYDQSVIHRYFNNLVPGEWVKDANLSVEECFTRSCHNIRANYLGWILREK